MLEGSVAHIGKVTLTCLFCRNPCPLDRAYLRPPSLSRSHGDAWLTASTITIGGTIPISGPAAAYGSVARGADAYFKYVISKGGVFGRTIDYKYLDDEFDVAKTITLTRQLVEQDQVLAIFNSVGTEHALAIRSYLNDRQVPQLFLR